MPKRKRSIDSPDIGSFSKNLLGLKFMKSAKETLEKSAIAKEDSSFDESICSINLKTPKHDYLINPSFEFCEKLKFGRLSFKGMNLEIESITSK